MERMFDDCKVLNSIPRLDTSNVTNMDSMFYGCSKLQTIPELNTSNVTSMSGIFYFNNSLQTIPKLDTSKVTNMNYMFYYCNSLTTIEELDMSSATSTGGVFGGCYKLSYIRLNGSLNVGLDISATSSLDYDSVKSILTAASNTTNTDSKELTLSSTQTDQNGELAALVSTCTSKGWTVNGLTLN